MGNIAAAANLHLNCLYLFIYFQPFAHNTAGNKTDKINLFNVIYLMIPNCVALQDFHVL